MSIEQLTQRRYRGPSGQIWKELSRNEYGIHVDPEYPTNKQCAMVIPWKLWKALGWKPVKEQQNARP